MVVRERTTR